MSTARQVPFENAVFVGDSPQDMHGENADEQLANPQKRICLIEFLHLGLIIVCQGSGGAAKIKDHRFGGLFIFSIFLMSDIFFDNIHAFDHQSCLPDMRTEPSFRCILP